MQQPELNAAAAEARGTDRFAEIRREHPDDRLIAFHDVRTGERFTLRVPPSSPWWPLLPPEQDVNVTAPEHGN